MLSPSRNKKWRCPCCLQSPSPIPSPFWPRTHSVRGLILGFKLLDTHCTYSPLIGSASPTMGTSDTSLGPPLLLCSKGRHRCWLGTSAQGLCTEGRTFYFLGFGQNKSEQEPCELWVCCCLSPCAHINILSVIRPVPPGRAWTDIRTQQPGPTAWLQCAVCPSPEGSMAAVWHEAATSCPLGTVGMAKGRMVSQGQVGKG